MRVAEVVAGSPRPSLAPLQKNFTHTRDKNPRQRSLDAMTTTAKFFLTHILEGKIKMRDDFGCGYRNLRGWGNRNLVEWRKLKLNRSLAKGWLKIRIMKMYW